MTIDWADFTPYSALAGGALLGIAVTILWLWNGRIAGISGILGGLLQPKTGDVVLACGFHYRPDCFSCGLFAIYRITHD